VISLRGRIRFDDDGGGGCGLTVEWTGGSGGCGLTIG